MELKNSCTLIGEVLSSSGPRKKTLEDNSPHNVELGEDSGGILMVGGNTGWMWVADGASDMHSIGGYSSRTLAQDLGRYFTGQILEHPEESPVTPVLISNLFDNAVRLTTDSWNSKLKHDQHAASDLKQKLSAWQNQSGGAEKANIFFEFASTFSSACLDSKGQLTGISIGDSYLMSNPNGLLQFFALKKGAVTLRLKLENNHLQFSVSVPSPENFESQNVHLVALATDGTRETFQHLQNTLPPEFFLSPKSFAGFRKAIGSTLPKTQDDKTLAWLGRINAG
ncbi:MAG: hypothetical protein G3M70_00500 [Candidatus Nitronauta litoralis]|uniref:Protein phosphatase 2C domain-containing protein n=1 Tax=Candidatus Nitronauta litoralis TaxID=2705533 RepID=A0A7T0BTE3_9BACT|nr:MAG: hypothetical protein G3M70_00500 [Candidatus Nitronauta litoralis]